MRPYIMFIALIATFAALADIVDISNGEIHKGGLAKYSDGVLSIDGRTIDRSEIARITFQSPSTQQPVGEQAHIYNSDLTANTEFLLSESERLEKIYPDAAGIVIIDHGTYRLRNDGTEIYSYHFAGKILKSASLSWGQRALSFEEGRDRVKINFARVISPDGEEFWWDTTEYSITEPSESGVFFSYGKVMSASFPQVGIGSIVEYAFEIEVYNPFDTNFFAPGFYFQDDVPTAESRCTVIMPLNKELNFRNYNWPEKNNSPTITSDENTRTYEWLLTDVPPFVEEPQAPSYGDLVPHFEGNLFFDWEYIYDWLGGLVASRMVANDDIKAKIAELTEGATDMPDSINRIYIWVQREIHYISIKGSIASGETGHDAAFTFEKKYGDCTDKSILFATMLREIGVEAYPIILMTNDEEWIPRDIPSTDGNHAITLIYLDGEKIFLDPTSTSHIFPYYRSDDVGVTYVCALCRDWDTTSVPPPEENAHHIEIEATLDGDGNMTAHYVASLVGDFEAGYRGYWEAQPAESRSIIMQDWISYIIPGAELIDWDLPGVEDLAVPFREEMSLIAHSYPTVVADLWILKIPEIEKDLTFEEVSLAERCYPIEYTAPYRESHLVTFRLPEGTRIEYLPKDIAFDNPYASYSASYRGSEDTIVFEDTYILKRRIIPVEDYKVYKDFCQTVGRYVQEQIFLKVRIPK